MFRFARTHAPLFGLEHQDATVRAIVVHDQDAFAMQKRLNSFDVSFCLALSDCGRLGFDRKDEGRAFAHPFTLRGHLATQHFHEALTDGQP